MPFDLPVEYVLGMAAWLVVLGVSLPWLLASRRRWSTRRSGWGKWANACLSMWVFLAALTMVELYFAIVYDQSDGANITNVSKHWYARHVDRDEKMLRFANGDCAFYRDQREFPRRLRDGQRHVCFLGDSFTFGHGITRPADRFSDRIGALLERKRPGMFVVSNLAEVGRSVQWAEVMVQHLVLSAPDMHVDTVVFVICLNDIEPFVGPSPAGSGSGWSPGSFLVRDTYFLNLMYYRIRQALSAGDQSYDAMLKKSFESAPWERMRAKIDDLRRLCADEGIDLRIAIFPFVHNLVPEYPLRAAHERIAAHCREIGLPVLDLLPVLEPHAREGLAANRFDVHPNERAHALAAEAIERDLLGDLFDP
jgi:lysophospholipase L1-like esterase